MKLLDVLKARLEVLMSINLGVLTQPQIDVLNEIMEELISDINNLEA